MSMLPSAGPQQVDRRYLSARLEALAELVRIGQARQAQAAYGHARDDGAGFSQALLDDAEAVLKRAGERLRLSSNHTVVARSGDAGAVVRASDRWRGAEAVLPTRNRLARRA